MPKIDSQNVALSLISSNQRYICEEPENYNLPDIRCSCRNSIKNKVRVVTSV